MFVGLLLKICPGIINTIEKKNGTYHVVIESTNMKINHDLESQDAIVEGFPRFL